MELSRNVASVGASMTIGITATAAQMKAEGADVVSFAAGEPDFDTPDFIKQAAVAAMEAGDTKYSPRQGKALLKAISEKLRRENDLEMPPEQIVVTFGAKHALYCAFQVLLNPGDKVAIPAPYWVSYTEMAKLQGAEPMILPTSAEGQYKITPDQVLQAAKDGAKILVLNSPSNPSGSTYTPDELRALAAAVGQTDLLVFSDEIYEKLIYGDAEFVSFASLDARMAERTLTFNGLAKTYAMTGWRLGWVAGPGEAIGAIRRVMSHSTTNPVSFAQGGALAAYTHPDAPAAVEAMRQQFAERRDGMVRRLNDLPQVSCLVPDGAFYCFPNVGAHYGRTLGGVKVTDSLSFAKAALEAAQIALVPGAAFGADECVRLSFATSTEQIDKGLDRLAKLLAE